MAIECSRCGGNHMRSECPTDGTAKNDHNCECSVCAERYKALRDILNATPEERQNPAIWFKRVDAARKALVYDRTR